MKNRLVKIGVGVAAICLIFGGITQAASLWLESRIPRDGELITIDGTRLHYRDLGTGTPIVLIHGLSGQMRNFAPDLVARLMGHAQDNQSFGNYSDGLVFEELKLAINRVDWSQQYP